jgi:hypothetical protein
LLLQNIGVGGRSIADPVSSYFQADGSLVAWTTSLTASITTSGRSSWKKWQKSGTNNNRLYGAGSAS